MNKDIYILGIGRNSIVTIDLAERCGFTVKGLYHYLPNRSGETYFGHEIIGCSQQLFDSNLFGLNFAISVGDNRIRAEIYNKLKLSGGNIPSLVHPNANLSKYSTIGDGVQIYVNAIIDPNVEIKENSIISAGSVILHGSRIDNHVFVAPEAVIGANTNIKQYAFVGLNATLISNKVKFIGENAIIGAASVITREIESDKTIKGNPGREIK